MPEVFPALTCSWNGDVIGDLVAANLENRIRTFVVNEDSEPLALFLNEARSTSMAGDWYGEHVGKWLVPAAHAAKRTGCPVLQSQISQVVSTLKRSQEENGYLGTYAWDAPNRFTSPRASTVRTWDLWTHAWMIIGLLEASRLPDCTEAVEVAEKIGKLFLATFPDVHSSPLDLGNHAGLSSSILVGPLAELTRATGNYQFADMATWMLIDAQDRGLRLLGFDDQTDDVASIGTGKAYQILWTTEGMVRLYALTKDETLLESAKAIWRNVRDFHLTPTGGPWGGVATHKEVFNAQGFFSPYGMVETCSTATWMTLCQKLYEATDDSQYIAEFERSLVNALLGSVGPDATDWSYFTFPNGRRTATYYWACCRSSGAMALELASDMIASEADSIVVVNLYCPAQGRRGERSFNIVGDLGRDGSCDVIVNLHGRRTLALRVPEWSSNFQVECRGEHWEAAPNSDRLTITEDWEGEEKLHVSCQLSIKVTPFTYSIDHHGQEVSRTDYAYLSRGPLVYSTGLIDDYRKEETLRIPRLSPESPFTLGEPPSSQHAPIQFHDPGRKPIVFRPYYETPTRFEGGWRMTWIQVAWQ